MSVGCRSLAQLVVALGDQAPHRDAVLVAQLGQPGNLPGDVIGAAPAVGPLDPERDTPQLLVARQENSPMTKGAKLNAEKIPITQASMAKRVLCESLIAGRSLGDSPRPAPRPRCRTIPPRV